jgi:hypothetical protein
MLLDHARSGSIQLDIARYNQIIDSAAHGFLLPCSPPSKTCCVSLEPGKLQWQYFSRKHGKNTAFFSAPALRWQRTAPNGLFPCLLHHDQGAVGKLSFLSPL